MCVCVASACLVLFCVASASVLSSVSQEAPDLQASPQENRSAPFSGSLRRFEISDFGIFGSLRRFEISDFGFFGSLRKVADELHRVVT